jgi:hypothetical protein
MEHERVCKRCGWVKNIGGGVWVCLKEQQGKVMMEVHPLQKGCDRWELREGVDDKMEKEVRENEV